MTVLYILILFLVVRFHSVLLKVADERYWIIILAVLFTVKTLINWTIFISISTLSLSCNITCIWRVVQCKNWLTRCQNNVDGQDITGLWLGVIFQWDSTMKWLSYPLLQANTILECVERDIKPNIKKCNRHETILRTKH